MKIDGQLTDAAVLREIGTRLSRQRIEAGAHSGRAGGEGRTVEANSRANRGRPRRRDRQSHPAAARPPPRGRPRRRRPRAAAEPDRAAQDFRERRAGGLHAPAPGRHARRLPGPGNRSEWPRSPRSGSGAARSGPFGSRTARTAAAFEYEPDFARSGIELSPLVMPLSPRIYSFPGLRRESFHGLPGLLADSLPDRFGHALIDAWLASQGRAPESFDAVERLCYVGARGMGALEFVPALGPKPRGSTKLRVDALVELASQALTESRRAERVVRPRREAARGGGGDPARRNLGRRREGEGDHRLESGHERGALRPGRRRRRGSSTGC